MFTNFNKAACFFVISYEAGFSNYVMSEKLNVFRNELNNQSNSFNIWTLFRKTFKARIFSTH